MNRKCHDLAYDPTVTCMYTFLLRKRRPDHPDSKGIMFCADISDHTPTSVCNELSYKKGTVFPYGDLLEMTMGGLGNISEEVQ